MKKILKLIILMFLILTLPVVKVYAAGSVSVSTNSVKIEPGKSTNITIKASKAAGRIDVSSSNSSVVKASISSTWIENESITLKLTAKSEGTAKITIKLTDVATFDGDELTGNKVINVTVKKAEADKTDSSLSTLTVTGYKINFNKNTLSYNIDVPNNITKLNVKATPSSSAASVKISGNDNLKLGKNKITVLVTAGNSSTKTYAINVNRKDDILETTQDELSDVIKNTTKDTIMLKITKDTVIKESTINEINKYNKNLIINKYNDNNDKIYSWDIDSKSLKGLKKLDAGINFNSSIIENLKKITNYSEGIYAVFNQQGKKVGKIKIYVDSLYKNDTKVNIYSYNKGDLTLVQKDNVINNSLIEFELGDVDNYIITRANINKEGSGVVDCDKICDDTSTSPSKDEDTNKKISWSVIIAIIEAVVIIGLCAKNSLEKKS